MMRMSFGGGRLTLVTVALGLNLTADSVGVGQGQRLGVFDGHGDVGSPKIAGSATYNAVSQEYAIAAGGLNMWAERDEFHFVWKRMTGDFILQARVELVGSRRGPASKSGLDGAIQPGRRRAIR